MKLSEEDVQSISGAKKEPAWMLRRRLEAYAHYAASPMPRFGPGLAALEKQPITWYEQGPGRKRTWEDVDPAVRERFEKLGVPQAERRFLAGLEAQMESESVYGNLKKEWTSKGVIFTSMDDALRNHPELLRKYLGKAIASEDNKFAALTDAVWSGGSFVYVPRGVKLDAPLHAYFMISKEALGQFERTVIIAEEGSSLHYVEGCFIAGTPVETEDGFRMIEDIREDECLLSHTGAFRKVLRFQKRGYTGRLHSISFYGDATAEITATEEHPFLCVRRQKKNESNTKWKTEWINANEIRRMDYLALPILKKTIAKKSRTFEVNYRGKNVRTKVKMDEGFGTLIGYYLSEGSMTRGEYYLDFSFGAHEKEKIEEVLYLLKIVFPGDYKINLSYHEENHGISIVVNSSILTRIFAQFGKGAQNKSIPAWMMQESTKNQAALLRGLFNGDGNYYKKKNKYGLKELFRICTVSRKLAYQTRNILLRLGIVAFINLQKRAKQGKKDLYVVGVGGSFLSKFGKIVGVECEEVAPSGKRRAAFFHIDDNYAYVPVKQIRTQSVKDLPVYNFSIEKDESYTVCGVAVHNCTAPLYPKSSLHTGVVEIFAEKGAAVRYTTLQNWSHNVYNLVTQRGIAKENATIEWIDANMGSLCTMKYPCVVLAGEGATGRIVSVAAASGNQNQDSGGRMMHLAPHTSSSIISKGISSKGGTSTFRAEVKIAPGAKHSDSYVKCQGIMLDDRSKNNSIPKFLVGNGDSSISHEASAGRMSERKVFYLMSRGLSRKEAEELLVTGFFEPFVKELPFEYAVEFNRLLQLEIDEGAI
jgi:Fe-S cluster assembly protein SufB